MVFMPSINIARELGSNKELAVKLEFIQSKHGLLKNEISIYKILKGKPGFPEFYWFGTECDYNIMVIDLLGPSLEDLLQLCRGKFSIATTFQLAKQMVYKYNA